jgi:hypothetical protein
MVPANQLACPIQLNVLNFCTVIVYSNAYVIRGGQPGELATQTHGGAADTTSDDVAAGCSCRMISSLLWISSTRSVGGFVPIARWYHREPLVATSTITVAGNYRIGKIQFPALRYVSFRNVIGQVFARPNTDDFSTEGRPNETIGFVVHPN